MRKFTPAGLLVLCLASAASAQDMRKPIGQWERRIAKNRVTLTIEENRLHISVASGEISGLLHADYAMTRDGVLYGLVTSVECEDEDKEADGLKEFLNTPFSLRYRVDEGALVIYDVKTLNAGSKDDDQLNGRFKAVRSTPSRPTIVPTGGSSYGPSWNPPSPSPSVAPPTPIAPSYLTPSDGEANRPKTPQEVKTIFNYWQSFAR